MRDTVDKWGKIWYIDMQIFQIWYSPALAADGDVCFGGTRYGIHAFG